MRSVLCRCLCHGGLLLSPRSTVLWCFEADAGVGSKSTFDFSTRKSARRMLKSHVRIIHTAGSTRPYNAEGFWASALRTGSLNTSAER